MFVSQMTDIKQIDSVVFEDNAVYVESTHPFKLNGGSNHQHTTSTDRY